MQITEGWNENLMGELYRRDGGVREWAGEAMINSQRMVVVSVSFRFDALSDWEMWFMADGTLDHFRLNRVQREPSSRSSTD
jgi:hypothetical protein